MRTWPAAPVRRACNSHDPDLATVQVVLHAARGRTDELEVFAVEESPSH
jgi:hypothetical protein